MGLKFKLEALVVWKGYQSRGWSAKSEQAMRLKKSHKTLKDYTRRIGRINQGDCL